MRISDWSSDVCSSDLRLGWGVSAIRQAVERLAGLAAGGRALAADELRHQLELLAEAMLQFVVLHDGARSEEHTSELQSLMRISYAVFCLKKKKPQSNSTSQ